MSFVSFTKKYTKSSSYGTEGWEDWVQEGLAMDKDYTEIHCDMPGDVWWEDCQEAKFPDLLDPET